MLLIMHMATILNIFYNNCTIRNVLKAFTCKSFFMMVRHVHFINEIHYVITDLFLHTFSMTCFFKKDFFLLYMYAYALDIECFDNL